MDATRVRVESFSNGPWPPPSSLALLAVGSVVVREFRYRQLR